PTRTDLKERTDRGSQNGASNESCCRVNNPVRNVVNDQLAGRSEFQVSGSEPAFDLSAKSGEGFEALLEQLTKHAETYLVGAESALVTRERHRRALEDVVAALRRALRGDPDREDLLDEELRIAAQSLGRLTVPIALTDFLH